MICTALSCGSSPRAKGTAPMLILYQWARDDRFVDAGCTSTDRFGPSFGAIVSLQKLEAPSAGKTRLGLKAAGSGADHGGNGPTASTH